MTVVDRLGTGEYRVQVQRRPRFGADGTTVIANNGLLTTTRIFWQRILDETSSASCSVPLSGHLGQTCCEVLNDVIPILDELVIYRNETPVWVGPILQIVLRDDEARIEAKDLTWWLNHRVPQVNRKFDNQDLSSIFQTLLEDAIEIDDFGLLYEINPSNILGSREIKTNEYVYFGDHLRELGRTGLDWTVYNRKLYAGGYTVPNATAVTRLTNDHFKNNYEISLRGDIMCTNAIVKGDGETSSAQWGNPDPRFGHIDQVWSEGNIKDYNSALQAAKTRWDMLKKPSIFLRNPKKINSGLHAEDLSSTDASILTKDAPITIEKLIPGAGIGLSLNYLCRQVEFELRIKRVSTTVENNENVELGLIPIGTSDGDA